MADALQQVGAATQAAWQGAEPAQALAHAVPYLQAFGHTVIAWMPWVPSWIMFRRLSRQYCSTGKSRV
ncbi:MAG: acyl-CoA dehydrogenase C-terminal domain-containing protein [Limnohabitans sp.]